MARTQFDIGTLRKAFLGVSGIYLFGLPLTFLMNIMLARMLSVEDFGNFGLVISLVTVLSIPAVGGMPMLLTREVSGYIKTGAINMYRGIVQSAHIWVLAFSTVVLACAFFVFVMPAEGNDADKLKFVALFLLPLMGLNAIRGGIMKGLGYPVVSELPTQVLQPVVLILGFWVLFYTDNMSLKNAIFWYIAASALVLAVAYVLLLQRQPKDLFKTRARFDDRDRWLRAIIPFAAMSAIWTLLAQVSILLLGAFGQPEAVAAMRVAERGAMLISFPLMFVNASIGPHIVNLFRDNDLVQLHKTVRYSARLAAAASIPIAAMLILGGRFLISVTFGEVYAELAYAPMVVLVVAQSVSVLLGPAGIMLAMTGMEKANLAILVIGLVVFVCTASLLIGQFGALGAAIGAGFGTLTMSTLALLAVRHKIQIWTSVL